MKLKPLSGRTILDCSTLLPGPFIGKLFIELGARVIKIENPLYPDGARAMGEFYADLNERKELIMLNLQEPQDRLQFQSLVRGADGLIEGFRPKAKIKLGLDKNSLHTLNPQLCIASLVGYRESGPRCNRAGHDLNFEALTGALSLFNEMPPLPLADLFAAFYGAFALAALLDAAARSNKGGRVVISLSETMLQVQSGFFREFQKTHTPPRPGQTLLTGKFPCYRIYKTQDGRKVAVGAIEEKFWKKLCSLLELPELSSLGYSSAETGATVIASVQKAFSSKPWSEWKAVFEKEDCCVEPILEYAEVIPDGL